VKDATVVQGALSDNSYNSKENEAMKNALRLIRDILPFSQSDPEPDAGEIRSRIDTMAGLSSLEIVTVLALEIIPAIEEQANLHMRYKLLEEAREEAEKALPMLERQIDRASLPLPLTMTSAALAADSVMKGLATGYYGIARSISISGHYREFGRMFLRAIRRSISMISRRQLLAYRTYAKPSASSWQMLHELYLMASNLGPRIPEQDMTKIRKRYLSVLIFAYIEPNKLPRAELTSAAFCARQLSCHARIGEVPQDLHKRPSTAGCFIVRPEEGSPGHALFRMAPNTPVFEGLLVDCSDILAMLDKSMQVSQVDAEEGRLDIPPGLMSVLMHSIGGNSKRRFGRKRFKPRADMVGGIAQVIPFLEGDAHARRVTDGSKRRRANDFTPSEWSLIDQSPDGFLVRLIQGESWDTGVGNVVALQPRETSTVHVCMVRRVATDSVGSLELGLQALSPLVQVIDLPGHAERRRGIYLHNLPAYGSRPAVMAQPGHLVSGLRVRVERDGAVRQMQVGRRLEASEGLELFALIPLLN